MRLFLCTGLSLILMSACSGEFPVQLHALDSSPGCFPTQFEDGLSVTGGPGLPIPFLISNEVNTASVTADILRDIRMATSQSLRNQIERAAILSGPVRNNPHLGEWNESLTDGTAQRSLEIRSLIRESEWGVLHSAAVADEGSQGYDHSTDDFVEISYRPAETLYEFSDSAFLISTEFVVSGSLTRGCDNTTGVFFESNVIQLDGEAITMTVCWVPSFSVGTSTVNGQLEEACFSAMDRVLYE